MTGDTLISFLVKRICTFARLGNAAISPMYKAFWQSQITTYHLELKKEVQK